MSDDRRRDRRAEDDFSEFGSLFDDAEPTQNLGEVDGNISFGDSDTGSLPHWTEPATGELPQFDHSGADAEPDEATDDELDVWSSFSSESPVWKDDQPADEPDVAGETAVQSTQPQRRVTDQPTSGQHRRVTGESEAVAREPSRITIGTDPSGMPRRPPTQGGSGRRRGAPPPAGARPGAPVAAPSGRDMPAAIAVGLLLAAAFIAALMYRPWAAAAFITIILGLAAVEFYDKVAERGYRPAVVPGIVTCVAAPLASYWLGVGTLPLVLSFGFMATAGSFIGARSVEAGPMPNVSITTLGIIWIGLLGSFAMLILRFSTNAGSLLPVAEHRGTDTLFLLALGVVANDVGALFIGSAVGRTPLRGWISPNKTVEGLIGGAMFTIIAMMLVGISESSDTWSDYGPLLALAVVISVMAPMGDLVESMFKRNLDVKDFGSIVKGHGGILDRFDGFLFTLPAVYYLTLVLEPWAS
ncbi:MAG: phosphatidate cytidylyltransferase [Ilumatobacter sp.]|uniref:phosphatidate cytidylyltransferase n=1 Tax=Ilumatobacter sp. TaxID=1967498 RepID=UPI00260FAA43|nr:phosphatidate cytidylyltransferase [Ilumatobacter sp.]MDJ0768597.1 phosphatidate cytidylyltransferase [Ilumatobacter sp.]